MPVSLLAAITDSPPVPIQHPALPPYLPLLLMFSPSWRGPCSISPSLTLDLHTVQFIHLFAYFNQKTSSLNAIHLNLWSSCSQTPAVFYSTILSTSISPKTAPLLIVLISLSFSSVINHFFSPFLWPLNSRQQDINSLDPSS